MIAFAIQAGRPQDERAFSRVCLPAIEAIQNADDPILLLKHPSSIHSAYEEARVWAAGLEGLEALVLVHADAAIMGHWFQQTVRRAMQFHDGRVIAGVVGVEKAPPHLVWWEGQGFVGGVIQRNGGTFHSFGSIREVEAVDGVCLILSPWAVRELRFDPAHYGDSWHAYDVDLAMECRKKGGKVVVAPLAVYHEAEPRILDAAAYVEANRRFRVKWGIPVVET